MIVVVLTTDGSRGRLPAHFKERAVISIEWCVFRGNSGILPRQILFRDSSCGCSSSLHWLAFNPVALALEWIGGQRYSAPSSSSIESLPLHFRSAFIQSSQTLQYLFPLPSPLPQRHRPQSLRLPAFLFTSALLALPSQSHQRRPCSHFHIHLLPQLSQRFHRLDR